MCNSLFILHGLNGSPTKTFQWEHSGFFWPRDLQQWLPNARIGLFGYNADTAKGGGSLYGVQQYAEGLLLNLRNNRIDKQVLCSFCTIYLEGLSYAFSYSRKDQ